MSTLRQLKYFAWPPPLPTVFFGMAPLLSHFFGGDLPKSHQPALPRKKWTVPYPISFITVTFALLDLVKEEVIVILASQFMIFFNETALEVCT